MKLLNIDELVGQKRPVILKGVQYEIKEQSIQQLIESVKTRKVLESKDEDSEALFESFVSSAKALLPDAPEAHIRELNLRQLQALIAFATASEEELVEGTAVEEKESGKP